MLDQKFLVGCEFGATSAQGAPAYDFKVVIGEIYQNAFVFYRMGYAGAQSVVLLLFVLCLVFIQFTLFRDRKGS